MHQVEGGGIIGRKPWSEQGHDGEGNHQQNADRRERLAAQRSPGPGDASHGVESACGRILWFEGHGSPAAPCVSR